MSLHSLNPADHIPLVVDIARGYVPPGHDVLDSEAFGNGMLGLALATKGYDPARQVEFGVFAARCVRNKINDGLKKHGIKCVPSGLQGLVPFTDAEASQCSGCLANKVLDHRGDASLEDQELVCRLLGCLNERERRLVVRVIMEGWTMEEAGAAEEPAITYQWVSMIIARSKRKMRKAAESIRNKEENRNGPS